MASSLFTGQDVPEAFIQGIDENSFDRFVPSILTVISAPALSEAQTDPIGGFITGAFETGGIDKRFQEHGSIPIAVLPIPCQSPEVGGESMAGQMGKAWENQEPGVIEDEGQILTTLGIAPANELITHGDFPCRRGPAQAGHGLSGVINDIAQNMTDGGFVSQVMMGLDQILIKTKFRPLIGRLPLEICGK